MQKEVQEELRVRLKLAVIEYADQFGVTKSCRELKVPRASFYRWKQKYVKAGRSGLYRRKTHRLPPPSQNATRSSGEDPGNPDGATNWSLTN